MGDENLKPADHLREWNGSVNLPLLHGFDVVDEDDKVIFLARVVDLNLRCVSTSHDVFVVEMGRFYECRIDLRCNLVYGRRGCSLSVGGL